VAILEQFMAAFQAPEFIKPYLHHFITEQEIELVIRMQGRSLTRDQIVSLFEGNPDIDCLLEQAYRHFVINKEERDGAVYYSAGDFYARLDDQCKFGNYHVLPQKIRQQLDKWCYLEYLKRNKYFKVVVDNDPDYENCHNDLVLLVPEVEEMIDAAEKILVSPCNCKMLADNCDRPREVCLLFDDHITDRTEGRILSKEEAKELLHMVDKNGLMHTGGPYNWREKGLTAVCNCCADCCYPFRAAQQLGTKGKWPKSRYIAKYDSEKCRLCGRCVQRCHFGAFYYDGTSVERRGKEKKNVAFNPDLCWGCGLCANTCPDKAITMEKL
jgi:NAD-dependent dihydropyrimidine dehydrogenase PreA subunit